MQSGPALLARLTARCCGSTVLSCAPQVICWVLGEYGTTDGKHSATSIVTSLCDLADRYSEDTTVRVRGLETLRFFPIPPHFNQYFALPLGSLLPSRLKVGFILCSPCRLLNARNVCIVSTPSALSLCPCCSPSGPLLTTRQKHDHSSSPANTLSVLVTHLCIMSALGSCPPALCL